MRSKIIFKNTVKILMTEKAVLTIVEDTLSEHFCRHFYEKIKKIYIHKGEKNDRFFI